MWQVLRSADNLTGWPPGKALEYLVLRAFQLGGAEVTWPYEVRRRNVVVEQVDGAVYVDGLTCLIEAKDHAEPMDFLRPMSCSGMTETWNGHCIGAPCERACI